MEVFNRVPVSSASFTFETLTTYKSKSHFFHIRCCCLLTNPFQCKEKKLHSMGSSSLLCFDGNTEIRGFLESCTWIYCIINASSFASSRCSGCSQRVPGADRACAAEQSARRQAAAAAAPADTEGPQRERPGRAGPVLHPHRRPRCQLVNHQRAPLFWIYKRSKKKKSILKKVFRKSRKKEQKKKNVKNTSPLKDKRTMLASFLFCFVFCRFSVL